MFSRFWAPSQARGGKLNKKNVICVFFLVQHEDASGSGSAGRQELGYLEEERVRVLARIDELKNRLMELEQQLQESKQEVQQAQEAPPPQQPVLLKKKQTLKPSEFLFWSR